MYPFCIALVACPDRASGVKIASTLVEEHLAACANVVDGVTSVYRWKNATHQDAEVLLIIKTRSSHVDALTRRVVDLHPYEVPEVITCDITAGNAPYLKWIEETTE